jgi:ADP-dependent NAD(P)H-hydrate dehydratase / NAD(P)H-hydrate epimerase
VLISLQSSPVTTTKIELKDLPKIARRRNDAHKGDFGHVFLLAGSPGLTGAGCLAARGAQRSGAGLVTVGCPRGLYPIFASKLTESMQLPLPENDSGALAMSGLEQILEFADRCKVVAIGPGLSRDPETAELVREISAQLDHVLVLDADAIHAFAGRAEEFSRRKGPTLITPHPGEMGALTGLSTASIQEDRLGSASSLAARFEVFAVLLKGQNSLITDGKQVFNNPTGNPGMATGGSGDVLTGIVAALVAQRLDHFQAGCLGAYVHGMAGDMAASALGQISMTPGDIIDRLAKAFESYRTGVRPRRPSVRP